MAHLYKDTGVKSLYADRKYEGGKDSWQEKLQTSKTLYIGNLAFELEAQDLEAGAPLRQVRRRRREVVAREDEAPQLC